MRSFVLSAALLLAGSAAMAADMSVAPTKAPAAFVSPIYNWTGFYAGVHAGYAAGDIGVTDTNGGVNPGPFGYTTSGGFGGGQIGYNWEMPNHIVLGVEGDFSYLGNSGSGIIGSANAAAHQDLTLGSGMLADVTGRAGYAVGPVLLYAKGGGAWFTGSAGQKTTNPGYETTGTGQFSGWTAGAGAEYMLSQNWTVKAEYLHYEFSSRDGYQTNVGDKSSPIGYKFMNSTSLRFDTIKAGVNYKF